MSVVYDIRKKQNRANAAAALLKRIVAQPPNTIWATQEMTAMLLARGDVLEAERPARNGARIAPESAQSPYPVGLSAHSRISAGDELPIVHELTNLTPRTLDSPLAYPEALSEPWMTDHRFDVDQLRDHYLQKAEQLGAVWFNDKMPLNETHPGLIALLFPESPILHLIRHPLDVVLSTISNLLTPAEAEARYYAHCRDHAIAARLK